MVWSREAWRCWLTQAYADRCSGHLSQSLRHLVRFQAAYTVQYLRICAIGNSRHGIASSLTPFFFKSGVERSGNFFHHFFRWFDRPPSCCLLGYTASGMPSLTNFQYTDRGNIISVLHSNRQACSFAVAESLTGEDPIGFSFSFHFDPRGLNGPIALLFPM